MTERLSSSEPSQAVFNKVAAAAALTIFVCALCVGCGEAVGAIGEGASADDDALATTRMCSSPTKRRCCGNGTCEAGETCSSCATDCGACGPVCGNGRCEAGESCDACSADCGSCVSTPGALAFATFAAAVGEGDGAVTLVIERTGGADGVVTVDWRTQGVTATFAADYGNFSWTTLTFADGEVRKTEIISIVDDALVEADESFNVLLGNPTGGAALGTVSTTLVTILDNDAAACGDGACDAAEDCLSCSSDCGRCPPACGDGTCDAGETCASCAADCGACAPQAGAFQLSASAISVGEGSGTVALTIERLGGTDGAVTIDWRTQGVTATFAADYGNFDWTTLSFAAGEVRKVKTISIVADALVEADETFKVLLGNPTGGATLGAVVEALVTILDDDAIVPPAGPLKVFPGAEGFGSATVAGRGGQILRVTNLNDSGAGSLRAAVQASGARIIVFEVGGHIRLASDLEIRQPFATIAGQTAPAPGIQISGGRLTIQTHDILLQHIRSRYGDYSGTNISHALRVITGAYNVVVDHCTLMWADDEVASIWTNNLPIHDVTFSNNIIAEGLGPHGYGTAIGSAYSPPLGPDWVDRLSILRNLYAHNDERDPFVSRDTRLEIANNLSYNAKYGFTLLGGNSGPVDASVVGNHFITGASNAYNYVIEVQVGSEGSHVYLSDNQVTGPFSRTLFRDLTGGTTVSAAPLSSGATFLPVAAVKDHVLAHVGARPAQRDAAELRVVAEVRTGTGTHKNSIAEAGGWPTDYATMTTRSLSSLLPADPSGDSDGDGYTNIEEVLHQLAATVEGR